MKRVGNLYEKIIDKNNIRKAILNAAKRKRKRRNVQNVIENITKATDEIYTMLKNEAFNPSPYSIHDFHLFIRTRIKCFIF